MNWMKKTTITIAALCSVIAYQTVNTGLNFGGEHPHQKQHAYEHGQDDEAAGKHRHIYHLQEWKQEYYDMGRADKKAEMMISGRRSPKHTEMKKSHTKHHDNDDITFPEPHSWLKKEAYNQGKHDMLAGRTRHIYRIEKWKQEYYDMGRANQKSSMKYPSTTSTRSNRADRMVEFED